MQTEHNTERPEITKKNPENNFNLTESKASFICLIQKHAVQVQLVRVNSNSKAGSA